MQTKPLGRTGLLVSEICLGTMQFGWYMDERASHAMLDFFVDRGGNFLDTADMYSNWAPNNPGGVSERIIGTWMKSRGNRDRIVLATKCRARMWEGADGEGLSRPHILRACEDSLKRLGTDRIDLYQAHWDDDWVPQEETMEAFNLLVKQGKVLHLGCSNFTAKRLQSALDISGRRGLARYDTLQPQYNLVFREEYEDETQKICQANDIACIPYSPLGGGLLTGKYHGGKKPESVRADYVNRYASDQTDSTVRRLIDHSKKLDVKPLQLALRWIMSQPTVVSPIIGASTNAQLAEILDAADIQIPAGALHDLI